MEVTKSAIFLSWLSLSLSISCFSVSRSIILNQLVLNILMVTDLNYDLKLLSSEIATSAVGLVKVSVGYAHPTNGLSKRTHVLSKS